MKIKFLDYAVKELDDTFEWYEAQQKNLGTQFLREFDTATKRICAYPTAYAVLSGNIRRSLIKRFPYGVLYAIEDQTIIIKPESRFLISGKYSVEIEESNSWSDVDTMNIIPSKNIITFFDKESSVVYAELFKDNTATEYAKKND